MERFLEEADEDAAELLLEMKCCRGKPDGLGVKTD